MRPKSLTFAGEITGVSSGRLSERVSSIVFANVAMRGFEAKFAFHLLNERPTSNRNRFRPTIALELRASKERPLITCDPYTARSA